MWTILLTILYMLLVVGIVAITLTDGDDTCRMFSRLMVVLFLPIVGVILHLFFGCSAASMRLISKDFFKEISGMPLEHIDQISHQVLLEDPYYGTLGKLLYNSGDRMVLTAPSMSVITVGTDKYRQPFEDISPARRETHLMYYIIASDELEAKLRDFLVRKAREGVCVQVIYDGLGSFRSDVRSFQKPFCRAGGEVYTFLPVRFPFIDLRINYRNHRRVVVIDQWVGYLGGMNVVQYCAQGNRPGRWCDIYFRIEGDAVVGLQRVFLVDWVVAVHRCFDLAPYFAEIDRGTTYGHPVAMQFLTNGPQAHWLVIEQAFVKTCSMAHEEILIQTPYPLPPEGLLMSLCSAAIRGVHAYIIIPERGGSYLTQRTLDSYLTQLTQTSMDARRHRGGFLHFRLMAADRCVVGVDSTNMDFHSLRINLEVVTFVYNRPIAEELCKTFEVDLQSCHQLTPMEWDERPLWIRSWEAVARLSSPLL